ncbi:MAG: hypothetical protein K1W00_08460 [Lachnospiraceae bacterium]
MKLLMKRRSVERIADTKESYEKLVKLGYTVKKDLEKENAAGTKEEKETEQEGEEQVNQDTASDENVAAVQEETEAEEAAVLDKPEAEKPKKPKSGKKAAEQEAK